MSVRDEWGNDPTVQMMRRLFSRMEKAQTEQLERLSISPFDSRLRRVRSWARDFFETTWPIAMRKGIVQNDQQAILLYLNCLRRALTLHGFSLPEEGDSENERIEQFLQETLG